MLPHAQSGHAHACTCYKIDFKRLCQSYISVFSQFRSVWSEFWSLQKCIFLTQNCPKSCTSLVFAFFAMPMPHKRVHRFLRADLHHIRLLFHSEPRFRFIFWTIWMSFFCQFCHQFPYFFVHIDFCRAGGRHRPWTSAAHSTDPKVFRALFLIVQWVHMRFFRRP